MELRKADVVCVVYAVDDEDTLDSGNQDNQLNLVAFVLTLGINLQ